MANDVLCVLESWRAMPPLRDCAEGDALDGSPTEDGSPVTRMDRDSLCGLPCVGLSSAAASDGSSASEDCRSVEHTSHLHSGPKRNHPSALDDSLTHHGGMRSRP